MIKKSFFSSKISRDQARDTGMAMVLILLIIGLFSQNYLYVKIGILCLIITMIMPIFYKYLAILWFGLSHILGTVASTVVLSMVFFLVVTPIGLIRRLSGRDTLRLKEFKAGTKSVMLMRNHTFKKEDINKPY